MSAKIISTKPGAERSLLRKDSIKVLSVTEPATLMEFIMNRLPDLRRTRVKELLAHNQVKVDSTPERHVSTPLTPGQTVSINFTREWKVFYNRRIRIVYEDNDIIVAHKGYGLLSMGTDKVKEGTAYSILREWVKWDNPANKLFIVHRLDRDTSGLMVFAKSIEAKEKLQHNWNNMVLNRKYLAVVEGKVEADEGVERSYLHENSRFNVYSTQEPEEDGQLAVTRWKKLKSKNGYTLLEVELDTGRKNQIRVHMADMHHPIAGDRKYGAKSSPIHRLALHAQTLRFIHPITRKEMNFATPVPENFERMLR